MKYLLCAVLGVATALYFGALPACIPGQPTRRTATVRRLRWLPASWGRHSVGPPTARPNQPATASRRKAGASAGHWVDDAERTGAAWARSAGTRIERGIAALYKESRAAVALARHPAAVAPRARSGEPPCDLRALNREYAVLLTRHRRGVSPTAAAARYDAVLFEGCRAFNQELERGDSLYHSPTQPNAELCGMSTELGSMRAHPRLLAQYILTKFDQSPRHAVIQARPDLIYVSASVTKRFFVVRLNTVPTR